MRRLYNYHFPTPSFLSMNSFAIDVSDQSIKYGEIVPTSSGLCIGRFGKEIIPSGIVVSGIIQKGDELVKILKKLKDKEKMHFIRVALPEEQMYLFTLSLPKANDKELRDMILLQIEEYIPLKATEVVFDYEVINSTDQDLTIEVVSMAANTMDEYLSIFERAGLVPLSFELEAQAIARAVIPMNDTNPTMVVDFGDSRTGISISDKGRVVLTTTIAFGGLDLTKMIAKNFSLSFEEAQRMKHEYGLSKVAEVQNIFPAILNGISVLRDELSKQCTYWDTHNNEHKGKINKIILCGGDSNLAGLSDYLELSMKIKVENANVWVNMLNTKEDIPDMSFEESLSYTTVLGLALGGYMYEAQSAVNILPLSEKRNIKTEYWMRFTVVVLNLLSILGVLFILLLFPSYFLSKTRESIVERQLQVFNQDNPDIAKQDITKTKDEINNKLRTIINSSPKYTISDKILENILKNKTSGIVFLQIVLNKDADGLSSVQLRGIAKNRDSLRNFKTQLESNSEFLNIDLPISNFLEKENLNFTISFNIK